MKNITIQKLNEMSIEQVLAFVEENKVELVIDNGKISVVHYPIEK